MSNEEYLAKKRDNSFTKEELFLMENLDTLENRLCKGY